MTRGGNERRQAGSLFFAGLSGGMTVSVPAAYLRTLATAAEPEQPPPPTRTTISHNPMKQAG